MAVGATVASFVSYGVEGQYGRCRDKIGTGIPEGIVAPQTAAAVLGHNFPDSPWYKDSYALLQSGGLAPREDQGSWISRAFRGLTGVRTAGG